MTRGDKMRNPTAKEARLAREAKRLRENLLKRKQQAQTRQAAPKKET